MDAFQEVSRQYALSYTTAGPATAAYPPTAPPSSTLYDFPARRQTIGESSTSFGRAIQPRPPSFPTTLPGRQSYPPSPLGEPSQKKKRGRPTKQEQEQRAAEAAARGEPYPPPKRQRSERPQSLIIEPTPAAERSGSASMAALSTPVQPQPDTSSETSSGRRRRGRPSNVEMAVRRQEGEGSLGERSPTFITTHLQPERGHPAQLQSPPSFGPPASVPESHRPTGIRIGGLLEETTQPPRTSTPPSRSFKETVGM